MNDINETLQCAICNETLEDPRPLPCGHSYCGPPRNCLKSMENSEGLLVCAICREEHSLKVENIKPLYGIRDYLQRDDGKLVSNELVCSSHQSKECSLWCRDCDTMICGTCFENDHDGHITRSLKRSLQEKVQLMFGSSPREGVSNYLNTLDVVIQKKDADVANKESQLASLRSELSVARSQKEVVSDVLKHMEQGPPSLSTLSKLSKLDVVDIPKLTSKDGKSETSFSMCTQTEAFQWTSICTQTQTSQFTSSTQTGKVKSESRASSTSDLDATMGVNNCKKCGIDHGPNVLSQIPAIRDISLRVNPQKLQYESIEEFIVCPYKFQLSLCIKQNFSVEFTLSCFHACSEPLPPFSFEYCLTLHNLKRGGSNQWSGVWSYPKCKVVQSEKQQVTNLFQCINADNCVLVTLQLNKRLLF